VGEDTEEWKNTGIPKEWCLERRNKIVNSLKD
jgi:hypothetical protein